MNTIPEHERLFDEICNKLNELSTKSLPGQDSADAAETRKYMLEKMQGQIRRFQNDLQGAQEELSSKIKNLESVQFHQNDLSQQLKSLTDQLNQERANNTKLNTDLAKSLEVSLQLQLEMQGLKARTHQAVVEEKKFNQSLVEKIKALQNEYELSVALREETESELEKAKANFQQHQENWNNERHGLKAEINEVINQKDQMSVLLGQMNEQMNEKNKQIQALTEEMRNLGSAFEELEQSAQQQNEVLRSLMETAETKIIEMKMALDRKAIETQDYYNHLQQSLTQCSLLKSENANLKDHIEKLNEYFTQIQQTQV